MKILITYFSQTNNTARVAAGICEALISQGQQVRMENICDIAPETLTDYDLVFVGSACHDADIAEPVKLFLEEIDHAPFFKMAGFVTHATTMNDGSDRNQELYQRWAGKCAKSFDQISRERDIEFLGYFHCQGAPNEGIADFINRVIFTDEDEWTQYIEEVRMHPNEEDIQNVKEFARSVLLKFESVAA
ncbi:MAG: hypothetical protein ISR58_04980 [Anaerolineales bacterium]|nr:hypothetical protein [Chloroflexota bacterium]MBL6980526.1 hypothetical protein [Anaerolineales bacterium]